MTEFTDTTLITLTADIVGAQVSNNAVATSDLPQLNFHPEPPLAAELYSFAPDQVSVIEN